MSMDPLRGPVPAVFEPVLDRLRADAPQVFDTPAVLLVPEAYEDRPYSHLLLVGVCPHGVQSPTSHVYVKVFKSGSLDRLDKMRLRVIEDFQTNKAVYEHLTRWNGLGTVRPVARYEDQLAIVTERAAGQTLLDHILTQAAWFPGQDTRRGLVATMEAVGRWIKVFQTFEHRDSRISLDALKEYVDVRLRRLVGHSVLSESERQRVLDRLEHLECLVEAEDLREVALHADLAPANILVSEAGIVVLDFAMATRGSYLHDISRLSMQIELLGTKPQYRAPVIRELQTALLRGFDPSVSFDHPLFRFLSILHRVNHFGTLSTRRERFPASLFSAWIRRRHRRWLANEIGSGLTAGVR